MKFLNLVHWSASIAHQVINRATNCATPSQPLKEPQKTVDYKQDEVRRLPDGRRHSESPASLGGPQKHTLTEKILLVDDEPAVLMGYERLLREELQVTTVALALQLQPPPTPRRSFPPILCFHRHSRFVPSIL